MSKKYSEPHEFILLVGRSLHNFGAAAHHIEAALQGLAHKYCEEGEFFVTPTAIISTVKIDGEWQTRLQRVTPSGIDLGKLSLLDEVGDKVTHGHMNMYEGIQKIRKINKEGKHPWTPLARIFFFVVASFCFGGFFLSQWRDLLLVAFFSLMASLVLEGMVWLPKLKQIQEFLVAFIVAFLSYLSMFFFPDLAVNHIILSSLIVLLPGLSITIALSEIGTMNWLAGTSRLMGASAELLKMTFGVVVGGLAGQAIFKAPIIASAPVEEFLIPEPVLLLAAGLSFSFLFSNLKRDYIWVVVGSCLAYYSAKFGGILFGEQLGVFWGGACIAAFSNVFARVLQRPALTVLLPGLIPMVPGSIGFRSVNFLFHQEVMGAMTSTFNLVIVAVALVAGLTIGNMIVHPRRSL